jgi:hypothetical protein
MSEIENALKDLIKEQIEQIDWFNRVEDALSDVSWSDHIDWDDSVSDALSGMDVPDKYDVERMIDDAKLGAVDTDSVESVVDTRIQQKIEDGVLFSLKSDNNSHLAGIEKWVRDTVKHELQSLICGLINGEEQGQ